jgi:hypothetical protein
MNKMNIIRALFLKATQPAAQKNYTIVHSTVKNEVAANSGKNYKFVCETNLVFTKQQILELPDKQAELLEQILKFRKLSKKIDTYEKTMNSKNQ